MNYRSTLWIEYMNGQEVRWWIDIDIIPSTQEDFSTLREIRKLNIHTIWAFNIHLCCDFNSLTLKNHRVRLFTNKNFDFDFGRLWQQVRWCIDVDIIRSTQPAFSTLCEFGKLNIPIIWTFNVHLCCDFKNLTLKNHRVRFFTNKNFDFDFGRLWQHFVIPATLTTSRHCILASPWQQQQEHWF